MSEEDLKAKRLFANGDYLGAYDSAKKEMESGETSAALVHLAILSLARSGATA